MPYYFSCSYPLGEVSVVKRGNWGRIERIKIIDNVNVFRTLREVVSEKVRLEHYSDRPSRFDCIFLCSTRESLKRYLEQEKKMFDLGYEVELINDNASRFDTNWDLVRSPEKLTLEEIERRAHQYWNPGDVAPEYRETLVKSDIRILRRI